MMPEVYLSLGSNIGDKEGCITKALTLISELSEVKKKSHLYITEPVGATTPGWFLNCVVEIETGRDPSRLLTALKSIERKLGRKHTVKNGPRTIDIDILFYGNRIMTTKTLIIPHPLIPQRLFVLRPMMDLRPSFVHPILKASIKEMYTSYSRTEKVLRYK